MALITTLITGAGIVTPVTGQSQCESLLVIGDVDTANPLQSLVVEIDGTTYINIQNQPTLITAFAKWQMESINSGASGVVGLMLKVATGKIDKQTNYRFTNNGATTPSIFGFSDNGAGVPLIASTKNVNPNSYEDFAKFSSLFLNTPANVASVEILFRDGHRATMSIQEVDAYFNLTNQAEADGRLGGVSVIDNTGGNIESVRINTNSTAGGVTVLVAKLPDTAFQVLKEGE